MIVAASQEAAPAPVVVAQSPGPVVVAQSPGPVVVAQSPGPVVVAQPPGPVVVAQPEPVYEEPAAPAPVVVAEPPGPRKNAVTPGGKKKSTARAQTAQALEPAAEPVVEQAKPRPARANMAWEVEEVDLAPVNLGTSPGTKILAALVVVMVLVFGFFATLATLNDGLLDFKQFSTMMNVAFSDGKYTPRSEWMPPPPPPVVAAPENPVEVQSVYAQLVQVGRRGPQVLVIKGQVQNRDKQDYTEVQLRGLVLDAQGRVLRQAMAPLGANASTKAMSELRSVDEIGTLLVRDSVRLDRNAAQPFTLIIEDPPQAALDGENLIYRVEIARKQGSAEVAAAD
jgi:hypothetical protein